MINDRIVFVVDQFGAELVRYNRAGKWRLEYPAGALLPSHGMNLAAAVEWAAHGARGAIVWWGRPGGRAFYKQLSRVMKQDNLEMNL